MTPATHIPARKLRESAGLSKERLAADAGISLASVTRFERGCNVSVSLANKIANVLGCTLNDLYGEAS